MSTTLLLLGLLYAVGGVLLVFALITAPLGFENEKGFQRGKEPQEPRK